MEYDLLFAFYRCCDDFDVRCNGWIVLIVGNACAVVNTGKFLLKVTLQRMSVIEAIEHFADDKSLLLGKVYQFLEVCEPFGHCPHLKHIPVQLVYDKSRITDIIDVSIDGSGGGAEFFGKLRDSAADVARHQFHQPENLDKFRLIHRLSLYFNSRHCSLKLRVNMMALSLDDSAAADCRFKAEIIEFLKIDILDCFPVREE